MQDAHSHFGPGPQQRSNAAMSREELRQISHRLSGILRYRVEEKGLTADSEGFVPFEDVCRACHRHDRRVIYTAAVNSVGKDGPRFEFRGDDVQGWFIRARHQVGHRLRRGPMPEDGRCQVLVERCLTSWPSQRAEATHEGPFKAEDPTELLEFLKAALAWLSGQVEVPDTQSLQHFVGNWKTMLLFPAIHSDDPHRQSCLRFIERQTTYLTEMYLYGPGWEMPDDRWYNWNLSDLLDQWEIEYYHSSWQMSWCQVQKLLERGQRQQQGQ